MRDSPDASRHRQGREQVNALEKQDRIAGSNDVLDRSQQEQGPYVTEVLSKEFIVLPKVFSPKYFAETAFYTRYITNVIKPSDRYLDVGCGAGVTTVFAALKGANVTSLDINPAAVENTRQNVALHNVRDHVRILQSDVYAALDPGEQFDVIYWNCPFGYRAPGTELTALQRSVFDVGYESNRHFILEAPMHLTPNGVLYMGVSSTLGQISMVYEFAKEAGIRFEQVAEMSDPDSPPDVRIMMQLLRGIRAA